jgi:hypothetical protein
MPDRIKRERAPIIAYSLIAALVAIVAITILGTVGRDLISRKPVIITKPLWASRSASGPLTCSVAGVMTFHSPSTSRREPQRRVLEPICAPTAISEGPPASS